MVKLKIEHDFHIHSYLSSCAQENATIEHYVNTAKELGLKKIGFSDHMWDSNIEGATKWYQLQDYDHIIKLKDEISKTDTKGIKIYFGCETEYNLLYRDVAITKEIASQLDFLHVPNSHTHITMPKESYQPYEKHAKYMINAFHDILKSRVAGLITAIVHPFFAVNCIYDNRELFKIITNSQFEECFRGAKEKDIAIEINISSYKEKSLSQIYEDPSLRMYHIAKDCGCKFIIGSDSHNDKGHEQFERAYVITSILGLTNDDFAEITQ